MNNARQWMSSNPQTATLLVSLAVVAGVIGLWRLPQETAKAWGGVDSIYDCGTDPSIIGTSDHFYGVIMVGSGLLVNSCTVEMENQGGFTYQSCVITADTPVDLGIEAIASGSEEFTVTITTDDVLGFAGARINYQCNLLN